MKINIATKNLDWSSRAAHVRIGTSGWLANHCQSSSSAGIAWWHFIRKHYEWVRRAGLNWVMEMLTDPLGCYWIMVGAWLERPCDSIGSGRTIEESHHIMPWNVDVVDKIYAGSLKKTMVNILICQPIARGSLTQLWIGRARAKLGIQRPETQWLSQSDTRADKRIYRYHFKADKSDRGCLSNFLLNLNVPARIAEPATLTV